MEDTVKAQKIKLAHSRKRFKELQELKKKRNSTPITAENIENVSRESTPIQNLSSNENSIKNEQSEENICDIYSQSQLPSYFNNMTYENKSQPPAFFFDSFSQNTNDDKKESILENKNNSSKQTALEAMVSNIVDSPKIKFNTNDEERNSERFLLFPQDTSNDYVDEAQQIIHSNEYNQEQSTPPNSQHSTVFEEKHNNYFEEIDPSYNISSFPQGSIENDCNQKLSTEDEIVEFSNQAKKEMQHSNLESLHQLSDQMAQLIDSRSDHNSITDLEKRNLELAELLEQEKINSKQQSYFINELKTKIYELESEIKLKTDGYSHQSSHEVNKMKEEIQNYIQTVGVLVAEKTELSANLSQYELSSKQKSSECQELQARLKASRSRVADLEKEFNALKLEREQWEDVRIKQNDVIGQLQHNCNSLKDQKEEFMQDLLELREKFKNSSEENIILQEKNQDLSSKLSLADIKLQQITKGDQHKVESELEKLTEEKFELEKQLRDLNQVLKTVKKEHDESSLQYQQYMQQQNAHLSNLSTKVEELQIENENLSLQEQNRIKHIHELENQLQNLQIEQVSFATNRNSGDANIKSELENTKELLIQLQIEKSSIEDNYTKINHEKEMLMKELELKIDSISQLESLVEQLQGNQPDSVKLLATMESDKIAAAKAIQQNKELKQQLECMQEVFLKLNNDKVELTEKLNREVVSNKELLDKLQKTEIHLQMLTEAIDIKDLELFQLREDSENVNKKILENEQLADRLRYYEAQDNSSHTIQNKLQEAQQMIVKLTNEINFLKHDKERKNEKERISNENLNTEEINVEKSLKHTDLSVNISENLNENNENDVTLDKEAAMRILEKKFKCTMQDIADLTEEKQRLEHLVLQLQGETETIGEYVALYQHQRMVLKQKTLEKEQQYKQLATQREKLKAKVDQLEDLFRRLIVNEKLSFSPELQEIVSNQETVFDQEYSKTDSIENSKSVEVDNIKSLETAKEIMEVLSEMKSSNLVQHNEDVHHCPWCSGQLITV